MRGTAQSPCRAPSLRSWLENNLDATVFPIAECLVHIGAVRERDAVRDDEGRIVWPS
ncbi:protein of unknown function (plasmid) [Caballeronia sp. S22]